MAIWKAWDVKASREDFRMSRSQALAADHWLQLLTFHFPPECITLG